MSAKDWCLNGAFICFGLAGLFGCLSDLSHGATGLHVTIRAVAAAVAILAGVVGIAVRMGAQRRKEEQIVARDLVNEIMVEAVTYYGPGPTRRFTAADFAHRLSRRSGSLRIVDAATVRAILSGRSDVTELPGLADAYELKERVDS